MRQIEIKKVDKKGDKVEKKKWKLRDGTYTTSYMQYRKDRMSAPEKGDYDPKTGKMSTGKGYK